jgi:hypothetical protein
MILFIAGLQSVEIRAQNLNLVLKTGLTVGYPLDSVQKLSFSVSDLMLSMNAGNSTLYGISTIRKLTFGINATAIPAFTNVSNVVIGNGASQCFNAAETVTIAGNGTQFLTEDGGSVEIVAGSKVLILPVSVVMNGGYFHATITTESIYCNSTKSIVNSEQDDDFSGREINWPVTNGNLRVYPNPAGNYITITIPESDEQQSTRFRLFNHMGICVLDQRSVPQNHNTLNISSLENGLYLLSVSSDGYSGIIRVLKFQINK